MQLSSEIINNLFEANSPCVEDCKEFVATTFTEECVCSADNIGTITYNCDPGENLGDDDKTCDDTPADIPGGCNNKCGFFGEWQAWSEYLPKCIDDKDDADTLFNDLSKHRPKRFRRRDCQYYGEDNVLTKILVAESHGRCLPEDMIETEFKTEDYQCEVTNSAFEEELPQGQVETKVVVDFKVEIYEEWNENLLDVNSDEFNNLAELYILGFLEGLKAVANDNVRFATVRVISFTKIGESSRRRRRRSDDLSKIEAEFESVYSVRAEEDATGTQESGVSQVAAAQITDQIQTSVDEKVNEVINPRTSLDEWQPGSLNFLDKARVEEPVFERAIVADYGEEITPSCDCPNEKRNDYQTCIPVEKDVSFSSK